MAGVSAHKPATEGDRHRAVPGTGLFKELIGNRPTLIMLDRIARHMCVAQTESVATGKSDLGERAVAFLMSLLEFAVSCADIVVVLLLADAGDAFSKEATQSREQLLDAVHAALLVYDVDGAMDCEAFLKRAGLMGDSAFKACLQAMINTVPRTKIKGKSVQPKAASLDKLWAAFFEELAVPAKEAPQQVAGQMKLM